MRAWLASVAAGACVALAGCVAPFTYQEIGPGAPFGYRSTANADGGYTILVVMPLYESELALAQQFWDRRAAEICGNANYRKIIFRAERANYYDNYGAHPGNYYLEGYAYCDASASEPAPTADSTAP